MSKYDFGGWATKTNTKCSDGRTIMPGAFKDQDGKKVPLIWGHNHDDVEHVLGHAILENREDGVYAYCTFNDTPKGQYAKSAVRHGDIDALSIYANKLKEVGSSVMHGVIREVSLVLAGANPGALIDSVELAHMDDDGNLIIGDEAFIYHEEENPGRCFVFGDELDAIQHEDNEEKEEPKAEEKEDSDDGEETIGDVLKTLNAKQQKAVEAVVGMALKHSDEEDSTEEGDAEMKHNVFDAEQNQQATLSHDAIKTIIGDAKKYGSVKESFLAHAGEYGIDDIEFLFPDAKTLNNTPEFIKRDMDWVGVVMNGVHHSPFSRVKSIFANITEDEARAKGYIKGKLKKEEVFSLLKRSTDPQTIYKKQKLDRDDVIDITDFDVIAWLKGEMRMMLEEEIARAILIGDGRLVSDDDHISTDHIRPIASDAALYTIQKAVTAGANEDETAKNFIRTAIKARKEYKGSGNPILFTTEDMLTDMLLLEDGIGHALYATEASLATKLRVSKIVTVPVMEGAKGVNGGDLLGVIVNLNDYNVGADKGGAVSMFDDFDIDYNQMKYLIETRCSGAMVKPYSAIALEKATA